MKIFSTINPFLSVRNVNFQLIRNVLTLKQVELRQHREKLPIYQAKNKFASTSRDKHFINIYKALRTKIRPSNAVKDENF